MHAARSVASHPETATRMLRDIQRVAAPVRQQVYKLMYEAIVQSELKPGERLTERDLCERYDVSRTSIREALRALEGEGLVTMVPNKGPVVTTVSAEEAADIYQVRASLEGLAGGLFAENASDALRDRLVKATKDIEKATASGKIPKILDAKKAFYDVLFEGAGNPVLRHQLRTLHARVTFLRSRSLQAPGRPEESLAEIQEIANRALARDAEGAWAACATHVQHAAVAALGELGQNATLPGRSPSWPASTQATTS